MPEPEPEPEPEPPVAKCSQRNETYRDPNTGQTWSTVFYCWNDYDAPLYQKPNAATPLVGYMESTHSWFVCYRHGQPHVGLNDLWYYTQGDRATSGWSGRAAWGYMAAANVETSANPFPGIPECAVE